MYRNKKVYITGGSSGIGLAIAKKLSGLGAHVIIFGRNKNRLRQAQTTISTCKLAEDQLFDGRRLDVITSEQVETVLGDAVRTFGAPDILINAAGIAQPRKFEDIPHQQFDQTIKTNLYGTWHTVFALLPHMKRPGTHIVNISSILGFIGIFGYCDYAASKFAIHGFSECLRFEVKQYGVRVSVLCPPDTQTPMLAAENKTKPLETRILSGQIRPLSADEVAEALIRGMGRGQFIIIPGWGGKIIYFTQRWFPSLLMAYSDRKLQAPTHKSYYKLS